MNTAIRFLKAHKYKVALPLLLLTTACGETSTPSQQADQTPAAAESVLAAAQPSGGFGVPTVENTSIEAPEVTLPESESEEVSFEDVLPPSDAQEMNSESTDSTEEIVAAVESEATAVPEPATLAGLAIAAASLVAAKRKQTVG